ncbi:MAG: sulfite exporter TauE/SafE family protein [Pseudomonadota bacterium]
MIFDALPDATAWIAALCVGLLAGLIKGVVGFALPVIIVSGLGTFLSPELALAGVILPALFTNIWQGLRQGFREAWASLWKFRVLVAVGLVVIVLSAQLVPVLPQNALYVAIGVPIVLFAATSLAGWVPRLNKRGTLAEVITGLVGGIFGGLSGMFGPPLILFLTAIDTPKTEQVRVTGVIFIAGSLVYIIAHFLSGILTTSTAVFSAVVAVPAMIGLAVGFLLQDRIDQATFRRITLIILLISGLNLIRRGVMG